MTDEKIKNSSELEFAVFCIENVAAKGWTLTGPTTTFPTMMRTWCPWSAGKVQPA